MSREDAGSMINDRTKLIKENNLNCVSGCPVERGKRERERKRGKLLEKRKEGKTNTR